MAFFQCLSECDSFNHKLSVRNLQYAMCKFNPRTNRSVRIRPLQYNRLSDGQYSCITEGETYTIRKQWTKAKRITISNYAYVRTNQAHSLIQFIYLFMFKCTVWLMFIFGRRIKDMVPFWCAVCMRCPLVSIFSIE